MESGSVGPKTKILHKVLKEQPNKPQEEKKHSGINVCSAKGNTLKNGVVSWIEPRKKHEVFMG